MTTVPMTRSDAVGVMSESTSARFPMTLRPRFSSCLYPSESSSASPWTTTFAGEGWVESGMVGFPSSKDLPLPQGGYGICTDLERARQQVRGGRGGKGEGLRLRRHGGDLRG